jgi:hypothetical protein
MGIADAMAKLWGIKEVGLDLGDWIVSAEEYSNEDSLSDAILYEILGDINTDKFKSKGYM